MTPVFLVSLAFLLFPSVFWFVLLLAFEFSFFLVVDVLLTVFVRFVACFLDNMLTAVWFGNINNILRKTAEEKCEFMLISFNY